MPRIVVDIITPDSGKTIAKVEEIAKRVFGPVGILPVSEKSTEIIPAFGSFGGNTIHIFLHQKPARTPEILESIWAEFKKSLSKHAGFNCNVFINAQPEKYWLRI